MGTCACSPNHSGYKPSEQHVFPLFIINPPVSQPPRVRSWIKRLIPSATLLEGLPSSALFPLCFYILEFFCQILSSESWTTCLQKREPSITKQKLKDCYLVMFQPKQKPSCSGQFIFCRYFILLKPHSYEARCEVLREITYRAQSSLDKVRGLFRGHSTRIMRLSNDVEVLRGTLVVRAFQTSLFCD